MRKIRSWLGLTECDPESERPDKHRFKRPYGQVHTDEGTVRLIRCADCGDTALFDVNDSIARRYQR
jgi:hypothetical protein